MEYIKIIFRTSFFYIFIILIYRIMGKREVGKLGIVDLIVSILIADLVTISVEDTSKSILSSIIPIVCLVIFELALSYGSLKSDKLRSLLEGSPSIIIKNGKINYNEMIKQKYNLDDLLTQLREKECRSIEEIEYAILESNGKLSIFKNINQKTPFPLPLILDGKIKKDTLTHLNKSEEFVLGILKSKNLLLKDIFYAFYKDNSLFIIKYQDLK